MSDRVSRDEIESELVLSFHDLWISLREPTRLPPRSAFELEMLRPWFGNIQIVDLIDGGRDVYHRLIGTKIVDAVGRDLTGKLVSACEYEIGTEAMLARYRATAEKGEPVFRKGRTVWAPDKSWRNFELVTAPLSENGKTVDQLITVMEYSSTKA